MPARADEKTVETAQPAGFDELAHAVDLALSDALKSRHGEGPRAEYDFASVSASEGFEEFLRFDLKRWIVWALDPHARKPPPRRDEFDRTFRVMLLALEFAHASATSSRAAANRHRLHAEIDALARDAASSDEWSWSFEREGYPFGRGDRVDPARIEAFVAHRVQIPGRPPPNPKAGESWDVARALEVGNELHDEVSGWNALLNNLLLVVGRRRYDQADWPIEYVLLRMISTSHAAFLERLADPAALIEFVRRLLLDGDSTSVNALQQLKGRLRSGALVARGDLRGGTSIRVAPPERWGRLRILAPEIRTPLSAALGETECFRPDRIRPFAGQCLNGNDVDIEGSVNSAADWFTNLLFDASAVIEEVPLPGDPPAPARGPGRAAESESVAKRRHRRRRRTAAKKKLDELYPAPDFPSGVPDDVATDSLVATLGVCWNTAQKARNDLAQERQTPTE